MFGHRIVFMVVVALVISTLAVSTLSSNGIPAGRNMGDNIYQQGNTLFLAGATEARGVTISQDCTVVSGCRVSFEINVASPEKLTMVYNAPNDTYAELDFFASNHTWVKVVSTSLVGGTSGSIVTYAPCWLGTYQYWFSSETNRSPYFVSVDIRVENPYTSTFTFTCVSSG